MKDNYNKIPKYQVIENDIIEQINQGSYALGDSIPSEAELSAQYNCSRVTVRQALSNLAFKGFINKIQGSGAYVSRPKSLQKNPLIKSFTEDMKEQGKNATSVVNSFGITVAGKNISSLLNIKESDSVYYIERTRFADNEPFMFERTFMSVDQHPDMSIKILQSSKYKYAEENGFEIEYSVQNIFPIFPPEYIANELKISTKQPMLKVANTTYLKDGRVFDYSELYMHPELYQFSVIKYR